ncbi:Os11g0615500 [Oryza sativa Japonica Group]|nr:hypothetical protein OsI_36811 [Oryza sativa Indica Group]EEE52463.1 hypothetical protein OsJ_34628 [Oryza sativa Japonica Group]BAT14859.1 Os11g0615500 [Oryza sativa Japonica Group]
MADRRAYLKRCVVALAAAAAEDAGEKIALMPCTAAHCVEQFAADKAMAARGSKRSGGTLVPVDGEEAILVPRGKLALSKKLVDKILSLERRELPHVADLLKDGGGGGDPNPSEAEKLLRKSVREMDRYNKKREDKLAECQAIIRRVRHGKGGYAVVDNNLEMRVAVSKAEGIFLDDAEMTDLIIDEGFNLASN